MEVCYGSTDMIGDWMELVRSVRSVFPGLETEEALEDHKNTVLRMMKEGRALCVMISGRPAGVLLLSRRRNMICFLAVAEVHRRKGIGSSLLRKALSELDPSRPVTVTTFRETDPNGPAPRALYKRSGFREGELLTDHGYPLQSFILEERA